MKIEQATPAKVTELWANAEPKVQKSKSLEEAAQELANELHTQFSDSVALARVFITVPFGSLPAKNKEFVQKLAESAGASS